MVKFYRTINFNTRNAKKLERYLRWFRENLSDDYHIIIEFEPEGWGREIDLLIICSNSIYTIEEKDFQWEEITINGPWKFKDKYSGRVNTYRRFYHGIEENPFNQAEDQAKQFERWLKKKKNRDHFRTKNNRRLNNSQISNIRVFPYVISPNYASRPKPREGMKYVKYLHGEEQLSRIIGRSWREIKLLDSGIKEIIDEQRVREISFDDLNKYFDQEDWWLTDSYLEQFSKYWGKLLAQLTGEISFEDMIDKYRPLDLISKKIGKIISEESPLIHLRDYSSSVHPLFSFPFMRGAAIDYQMNQELVRKGIDKFEAPFAKWKMQNLSFDKLREDRKAPKLEYQRSIDSSLGTSHSNDDLNQLLKNRVTWIHGEAGSGKSYTSMKIWHSFMEDYISNESKIIPVYIPQGISNREEKIDLVLNSVKSGERIGILEKFVNEMTFQFTNLNLPKPIYLTSIKIHVFIDGVEEFNNILLLSDLLNFLRINKVPFTLFLRSNYNPEIQKLIEMDDSLYEISHPNNQFIKSFLTENQIANLHTVFGSEVQSAVNPLILSFIKSDELFKSEVPSDLLFNIIQKSIQRGFIASDSSFNENEINRIYGVLSKLAYRELSLENDKKSKIRKPKKSDLKVLISSGLLVGVNLFRHQIFSEYLACEYWITHNLRVPSDIKIENFIKNVTKIYQRLKKSIDDEKIKLRLENFIIEHIKLYSLVIGIHLFPQLLSVNYENILADKIFDELLPRRFVKTKDILLSAFSFNDSDIMFDAKSAMQIMCNDYTYSILNSRSPQKLQICLDNLHFTLDKERIYPFGSLNLLSIKFLQENLMDRFKPTRSLIITLGLSKSREAAFLLIRYLINHRDSYKYKPVIQNALENISYIAEDIYIDTLKIETNSNVLALISKVLSSFKSAKAKPMILKEFENSKNLALQVLLAQALFNYDDKLLSITLINFIRNQDIKVKSLFLNHCSQYPTSQLAEYVLETTDDLVEEIDILDSISLRELLIPYTTYRNLKDVLIIFSKQKGLEAWNLRKLFSHLNNLCRKSPDYKIVIRLLKDGISLDERNVIKFLENLLIFQNEKAISEYLNLIEEFNLEKSGVLFFLLADQTGKYALEPIHKKILSTSNSRMKSQLVHVIGLLGYSESLKFLLDLVCSIPAENSRYEELNLHLWAILRICSRYPRHWEEILKNFSISENASLLPIINIVSSQLKRREFMKPLKGILNQLPLDHLHRNNVILTLFTLGDDSFLGVVNDLVKSLPNHPVFLFILGRKYTLIADTCYERLLIRTNEIGLDNKDLDNLDYGMLSYLISISDERVVEILSELVWKKNIEVSTQYLIDISRNIASQKFLDFVIPIIETFVIETTIRLISDIFKTEREKTEEFISAIPELHTAFWKDLTKEDVENFLVKLHEYYDYSESPILYTQTSKSRVGQMISTISISGSQDLWGFIAQRQLDLLEQFQQIITNVVSRKKINLWNMISSKSSNVLNVLILKHTIINLPNNIGDLKKVIEIVENQKYPYFVRKNIYQTLLDVAAHSELLLKEIWNKLDPNTAINVLKYTWQQQGLRKVEPMNLLDLDNKEDSELNLLIAFVSQNRNLIIQSVELNIQQIQNKELLQTCLKIIGDENLQDLTFEVMRLHHALPSIRNDAIECLKKLGHPYFIDFMLQELSTDNISLPSYEIPSLFNNYINSINIENLIYFSKRYNKKINERNILQTLSKIFNEKPWNMIFDINYQLEEFKEDYTFATILEEYYAKTKSEKVINVVQDGLTSKNSVVFSKALRIIQLNGNPKYIDYWIDIITNNDFNRQEIYGIQITSIDQFHKMKEVLLSNQLDLFMKRDVFPIINWNADLEASLIFQEIIAKNKSFLQKCIDEINLLLAFS